MSKKLAIIYVTYDGALNSASGVGVLSQYFIQAMPSVVKKINKNSKYDAAFHVIAIKLNKNADGFSEDIKQTTEQICQDNGGELHLIENGLHGVKGYGGPANWAQASNEAAVVIQEIVKSYDRAIVYLIDTPFMSLPAYIANIESSKISFVIVPHSDTFTHFPDDIQMERLGWEAMGLSASNVLENVYIAATSQFMIKTLIHHYPIKPKKIIPLQTGLLFDSTRLQRHSDEDIRATLTSYGIPLDRKIIFSVGRGVPYKGFTNLIKAFSKLNSTGQDAHLVFIAPPHKNEVGMTEELELLIESLGIRYNISPIYRLDMKLPQYMYQWENTAIVAQLSLREPFGMVPEEVRISSHATGPVVVASNLDGFIEQIDNDMDGFLVDPNNIEEIAACFERVLTMEEGKLVAMAQKGRLRASQSYDYVESITESLHTLLLEGSTL